MIRRLVAVLTLLFAIPAVAGAEVRWNNGLTVEPEGKETFTLRANGLLQPRYEYESRDSDGQTHSSMSIQRARAKVSGTAYTEHLRYGGQVEFAGNNVDLLDAWVEYRRFDPYYLRMGQFAVPFNRERDLGVANLLGTQRSIVNREFQWPTGRDAGFMVTRKRVDGLRYRVGVFGGGGRGSVESSSNGMLASGRLTYELLGEYEARESFHESLEGTNLSLGVGSYYAHKNNVNNRDWFAGPSSDTANVLAGTLDVQWRSGPVNLSASYVHRSVESHPGTQGRYDGNGYSVEGGYVLESGGPFLTARHAQTYPDRDNASTRRRTNLLGLHLFQKGNSAQTRFEAGVEQRRRAGDWIDDEFVRVQQQLAF